MKYYKYGKSYYRIGFSMFEKVMAYHHHYGIEFENSYTPGLEELIEITEKQYNRAKRLIVAKIQQP